MQLRKIPVYNWNQEYLDNAILLLIRTLIWVIL